MKKHTSLLEKEQSLSEDTLIASYSVSDGGLLLARTEARGAAPYVDSGKRTSIDVGVAASSVPTPQCDGGIPDATCTPETASVDCACSVCHLVRTEAQAIDKWIQTYGD